MLCTPFADINALGITTTQFDNRRCHQAVIQHNIGLLHQAQGAECQQIRITRPCANQIHLAQGARGNAGNFLFQQTLTFLQLTGEYAFGHLALEHILPEHPSLLHIGEEPFDLGTKTFGQTRQLAIGRGNPRLDLGANQPRQYRSIAATGNRHNQR